MKKNKKKFVYTSDGKYEVLAGKIVIARSYLNCNGEERRFSVRILQGMDRDATIKKICEDCPDFAANNEIDENYYPYLFADTKKNKTSSVSAQLLDENGKAK
jgi:hypothetical protein